MIAPDYLGKRTRPIDDENKVKWDNNSDESCRLIRISISHDLRFHIQGIDGLDKA
jgi:hypothetical protein